ncbi:hypothetical protein BDY24DRAFT_267690 [Mrakia frigida]|uniref:uncharacterized protein n=1 Tax=Mrakia frigida TaxID=29902 RepID=UPI003FCBFBFA
MLTFDPLSFPPPPGIAFISHLSFPSATPSSSTAKLGASSSAAATAASPIFPPRGSTSTTPTTHSFLPPSSAPPPPPPQPSSLSSPSTQLDPATLIKPKPKRAVLFSSGIESASNPAHQSPSSSSHPTEGGGAGNNTPKASSQFFSTTIPSPSPFPLTSETDLLLSLALESLKGRPSIRYRGLVRIGVAEVEKEAGEKVEGTVEGEGGVRLYTDPRCPLVLNFLRRQLLLLLSPSSSSNPSPLDASGRTTHGILIGLGDESVESSNLIIYALSSPSSSSNTLQPQPMTLHLGRYNPSPPTPLPGGKVPPRPDDPAPRRPPFAVSGKSRSFGREREKRKSVGGGEKEKEKEKEKSKRTKPNPMEKTTGGMAVGSGSSSRRSGSGTRELEEPEKGRGEEEEERDVFGSRRSESKSASAGPSEGGKKRVSSVGELGGSVKEEVDVEVEELGLGVGVGAGGEEKVGNGKGKEKDGGSAAAAAAVVTASGGAGGGRKKATSQETHNKAHIKTAAIQALLEREITKDDPEFKELWNWVVRGSGFALRNQISTKIITALEVQRVVGAHLELYLPAC